MMNDTPLPNLIEQRAGSTPDDPFVVLAESGASWSYAQAAQDLQRWAGSFSDHGVAPGDTVLTMLPPSTEAVACWLGIARLRALEVPVNVEYVGEMLGYIVADAGASTMVAHLDYLPAIESAVHDDAVLRTVVIVGATSPLPDSRFELLTMDDFLQRAGDRTGDRTLDVDPPAGRDVAAIIYTSGTTGPSKGVLVTWRQAELTASAILPAEHFGPSDAMYSAFPMFHMSGKGPLYAAAIIGARVVMRERFSTDLFWDDVRKHGATSTIMLGAIANFLYQQPEHPSDADNPLRDAVFLPLISDLDGFKRRFGLQARTTFNMTETACCILNNSYDLANDTSCGAIREGFTAKVVDADDEEVAPGMLGELVLRADRPWSLMNGYWNKPDATVNAWRNQWLHTGDGFTRDEDGNFYFVDRIKDAIRRRGENISSAEVESLVLAHPDVIECAAIAVPSEYGEDEVKVVVVRGQSSQLSPEELIEFLEPRMPRFMVPRYLEFASELPKTPTQKIRKVELRAGGINDRTWDRRA